MAWPKSNRTGTRAWRTLRASVLLRDGYRCTRVEHGQRCTSEATTVDHVHPAYLGGTDDPTNLASLCQQHHDEKTKHETATARWANRAQRTNEQHPGLKT